MNRRSFLVSILAAGIAPAIIKPEHLMVLPRRIRRNQIVAVADFTVSDWGEYPPARDYDAMWFRVAADGTTESGPGVPDGCRVVKPRDTEGIYLIERGRPATEAVIVTPR